MMRLAICLLLLPALSLLFAPASSTLPLTADCPAAVVICPDAVTDNGKTLTFRAEVRGISSSAGLTYHWRVSDGMISKGQNTSSIMVDTRGLGRDPITAAMQVGGLPTECPNKASCTTAVAVATMSR